MQQGLHIESNLKRLVNLSVCRAHSRRTRKRLRFTHKRADKIKACLYRRLCRFTLHREHPPILQMDARTTTEVEDFLSNRLALFRGKRSHSDQGIFRTSAFNRPTGSTPIFLAISTNSTTSSRRSPFSYLATKDCGRFNRFATCSWVKAASFRARLISARKAFCPSERLDFRMLAPQGIKRQPS